MLNLTYTLDTADNSLTYAVDGTDTLVSANPVDPKFWVGILTDDGDDVPAQYEVVCGYTGHIYLAQSREDADHLAWALAIAYNANQYGVGIATKTIVR